LYKSWYEKNTQCMPLYDMIIQYGLFENQKILYYLHECMLFIFHNLSYFV